jgi:hypothetical protein
LRALRVAPARQLALLAGQDDTDQLWWDGLPEQTRVEVLRLLARMIARSVVAETTGPDEPSRLW